MKQIRIRVGAVIVEDGRMLAIACEEPGFGPHLNFPGGGMDAGETVHEAVRREVREECDCEVEVGRLLILGEYRPPEGAQGQQTLFLLFHCTATTRPKMPSTPDTYQVGLEWVPLVDLAKRCLLPPFSEHLVVALEGRETVYAPGE